MSYDVGGVIDTAIRERHIVSIDYVDRHGKASTFEAEPYSYKHSSTGHAVLWVWNLEVDRWEELFPERIVAARDTGRIFEPREDWESVIAKG